MSFIHFGNAPKNRQGLALELHRVLAELQCAVGIVDQVVQDASVRQRVGLLHLSAADRRASPALPAAS